MARLAIYLGTVKSVSEKGLLIYFPDIKETGLCPWFNLTDYPENESKLSEINSIKKFVILNTCCKNQEYLHLSYKYIHPEEQKIKRQTIPTANHFYALRKFLSHHVNKKTEPEKNKAQLNVLKFLDLNKTNSKK